MAVGVENVCEQPWMKAARPSGGHVSIEINDRCPFEEKCSSDCFLVARDAPRGKRPAEAWVLDAFEEVLDCSERVRHFAVPAMEPLASPELLFAMLERYHQCPSHRRPLTFNCITSGFQLNRHIDRFVNTPLTGGLIISVDDTPSTGLRVIGAGESALRDGLRLRERGGAAYLVANTVLTRYNADAVLRIGGVLADAGLDQWLVGFKTSPSGGRMVSEVSDDMMLEFAYRAADQLAGRGMHVLVHLDDYWNLAAVPGGASVLVEQAEDWRLSASVAQDIDVICWNPAARFLRIRGGDSVIMTHDEFVRVGVKETVAGYYKPGSIRQIIHQWPDRIDLAVHGAIHAQ